jgi:hypothetical protein
MATLAVKMICKYCSKSMQILIELSFSLFYKVLILVPFIPLLATAYVTKGNEPHPVPRTSTSSIVRKDTINTSFHNPAFINRTERFVCHIRMSFKLHRLFGLDVRMLQMINKKMGELVTFS